MHSLSLDLLTCFTYSYKMIAVYKKIVVFPQDIVIEDRIPSLKLKTLLMLLL